MPFWEWLWIGTALAGVHLLFGRALLFQHSYANVNASLVLSFITYARFCYLVIGDIINFLGIECFIVRKKAKDGEWHSTVPRADVAETAKSK